MNLRASAWSTLFATGGLCATWFAACSSDPPTLRAKVPHCGDGVVDFGEMCDDGNLDNSDQCDDACQRTPFCGDGTIDPGEYCDDGNNIGDDACNNVCDYGPTFPSSGTGGRVRLCGNGQKDAGEFCDDGNFVNDDECPNDCAEPVCGDGITQAHLGEDCDDGIMSDNDMCPDDCMIETTTAGGGGPPIDCDKMLIFHSIVSNPADPTMPGMGSGAVWAYNGSIGTQAGHDMCKAVGAFHVCSYRELRKAHDRGELDTPQNQAKLAITNGPNTFWLHRIHETVTMGTNGDLDPNGISSPPGPGGRCNDWTYPTGHIADGEYVDLSITGSVTAAQYHFDQETKYSGVAMDGYAGSGPMDGGPCNGSTRRDILCCYEECIDPNDP